jgi:hypothetical protein
LVVQCFTPLEPTDANHDYYQQFGFAVAGTLFYGCCRDPEVIHVDNLATHFAKTTFMPVIPVNFHESAVHALPLYKASSLHGFLQK